ncbi:MAG: alpha/beta hydrolase [Planctomycetota bacterium]|nr:alpha/beta hydrolase [Planctomycetota bacterium]
MTARLHHLARSSGSQPPRRWAVILHGILGSGGNWAGFARDLALLHPTWGVMAVDLRLHGRSSSGSPPDRLESCVEDVLELTSQLGYRVEAAMGHSFGSKIALQLGACVESIRHVISVDADPGPLDLTSIRRERVPVLRLLDELRRMQKMEFTTRREFDQSLDASGFGASVAGWVGKNLVRSEGRLRFPLDIDRVEAMLLDQNRFDAWPLVESSSFERISFCIGGLSRVVSETSRGRLEDLQEQESGRIAVKIFEGAGHWVHIDAADELLKFVSERMLD